MTQDKLEDQFGEQYETLKDMVADESFGMRSDQFENIAEKIYSSKVNKRATEEELELIKKVGLERNYYLDDGSKWYDLVQKVEEIKGEEK